MYCQPDEARPVETEKVERSEVAGSSSEVVDVADAFVVVPVPVPWPLPLAVDAYQAINDRRCFELASAHSMNLPVHRSRLGRYSPWPMPATARKT